MSDLPGSTWLTETLHLRSFDGGESVRARCVAPDRYRFWDSPPAGLAISRGAGLSYTAASLSRSALTVSHRHFDRLLAFDSSTNMLEVEAGATLGQIYDFAARRRLFLPVQPGHPRITVGGCIAADVHGKNQFRDGTFLNVVESLRLFHPRHGMLELSRTENLELFYLTCGGYGLTGHIMAARLRLASVPSTRVRISSAPLGSVAELIDRLPQSAAENDLVYSWHDLTVRGDGFGRGTLISGRFAEGAASEPPRLKWPGRSLDAATRGLPVAFFNSATTPLFNRAYHTLLRFRSQARTVTLDEFLFPVLNKELYFHLFGKRGFHECQFVVPADAFASFTAELRRRLESHPVAIALASAKLFRGSRDLLRFTGDGICLALDFPRNPVGAEFATFLDSLLLAHSGWPNLIKDSRLSAQVVAAAYPEYELFRSRLRAFDPERLFRSELSERLDL